METATRNYEFRLYPTPKQEVVLLGWLGLHCELYNAALQERRDAWRKNGIHVGYNDQQNQLPAIKIYRPELKPLGSHALQETVRRVDRAFAAFFRRVKAKSGKAGFPRFRSRKRYDSFCYPDPAGWKVEKQTEKGGKLRVSNLGSLTMRGKTRVPLDEGERRTLTVQRRQGHWYATFGYRHAVSTLSRPETKKRTPVGIDGGVKALAYLSDGTEIENPKYLARTSKQLKLAQRELSRKKRGSKNRGKARDAVSRLHRRVANQRKNFLHQLSTMLVGMHCFIAVEDLKLKNMTRSAKGTPEKPGRRVKQKSGLNRSMLDASLGMFYQKLEYKAVEAGTRFERVDPSGTTQNCARCGEHVPKQLKDRWHSCPACGFEAHRDHNAAINILSRGFEQSGREPSEVWRLQVTGPLRHETTSMRQHGAW